ncbi:hypothetical protein ACJX0J_038080 [Zea mays]
MSKRYWTEQKSFVCLMGFMRINFIKYQLIHTITYLINLLFLCLNPLHDWVVILSIFACMQPDIYVSKLEKFHQDDVEENGLFIFLYTIRGGKEIYDGEDEFDIALALKIYKDQNVFLLIYPLMFIPIVLSELGAAD